MEELLDRGIAVITAVNLQHIAEQQDEVERITGKRAANSVPQAFLAGADEIEVVDAPPDALIARPGDSSVSDARRLAELRELALLLAADVVEEQLQDYLESNGVTARWGAQERILVCLTARSNARPMLESGQPQRPAVPRRPAGGLCRTGQPFGRRLRPAGIASRHWPAQVGAEVHCLYGDDFVETILDFAREQRVTQLFLGHTGRDKRWWWSRNSIERLIDAAETFDVRLFPHKEGA